VAEDGELPSALDHRNRSGVPDRAVIVLGGLAAVLTAVGSLVTLVEAASLSFLFTFAVVCGLAFRERVGWRLLTGFGALAAGAATLGLAVRSARTDPMAVGFLMLVVVVAVVGRPRIVRAWGRRKG
jgi:hypothetical protein